MYEVDKKDRVAELTNVPQSSIGAPIPVVLSDEHTTTLAYYVQETPGDWDGTTVRVVGPAGASDAIAIVRFEHCYVSMFGPPNDEAFAGHPLAGRGLQPYAVFEVLESSWVRKLEQMNSVHAYHRPSDFSALRHYIFAFHDSTFECVAKSLSVSLMRGSMEDALPEMRKKLGWHAV